MNEALFCSRVVLHLRKEGGNESLFNNAGPRKSGSVGPGLLSSAKNDRFFWSHLCECDIILFLYRRSSAAEIFSPAIMNGHCGVRMCE